MKSNHNLRPFPWMLIGVFFLLTTAVLITGHLYYQSEENKIIHEKENELTAIADLKVEQISQWRNERIGDAQIIFHSASLIHQVESFFRNPDESKCKRELLMWMKSLVDCYYYSDIYLMNPQGTVELSVAEQSKNLEKYEQQIIKEGMQRRNIFFSDLYKSEIEGGIHIDLLVPLLVPDKRENTVIGAFLLRIDPGKLLFPIIQSWPIPSPTSEALLIRREGDSVLFLNELRHRKNTALTLRMPISQDKLPASMAVRGVEGVVKGIDYREIPVLASIQRIPNSPWFMIAKVDQEEIFTPFRRQMTLVMVIIILIILVVASSIGFWWRYRLNEDLERRVKDRTAQLEAANKELESFAYSVSHDLRAPLRGIDGWSSVLMEDFHKQLNDQARQNLDKIRAETQRMEQLIDDLLNFSKITRVEIERSQVDLTKLAHSIIARLQKTITDRHMNFIIESGLSAWCDANLLDIVLTNLFDNACKFTRTRAIAQIEFGRTHVDGKSPFFVRDNGVGFNMQYAQNLFGVFWRLHKPSEFPGTGIGLATVQRIIRRLGGNVWADAHVDEGATFYFTLKEDV